MLLTVALIGSPLAFEVLGRADAGRVVGRLFTVEAQTSLALAVAVVLLERQRAGASLFNGNLLLALLALFCTVAGEFVVRPMMDGALAASFAPLHAASLALYGIKTAAVLALVWRVSAARRPSSSGSSAGASHA
jgi:hypothetical protein